MRIGSEGDCAWSRTAAERCSPCLPHPLSCGANQQVAGVRLIHAPYVDTSQMSQDVMSGRVDATWDWPLTAEPNLREGWLRALAVADFDRVRLVSDVPTSS
jgi:tripartite-type tricarboxylate transporter receptor subunit TctC